MLDYAITEQDYRRMRRKFRNAARPYGLGDLLDAEQILESALYVVEPPAHPNAVEIEIPEFVRRLMGINLAFEKFFFNIGKMAFQYATGIPVEFDTLFEVLNKLEVSEIVRARALTEKFVAGKISDFDWKIGMRRSIKDMHTLSAVMARGGWNNMTRSDWGFLGSRLRMEYGYFDDLFTNIRVGRVARDRRLLLRANNYMKRSYQTYEAERRRMIIANRVYTQERRIALIDACQDCEHEAHLGWVPVGRLRSIGDSICLHNCRCHFQYR